MGTCLDCDTNFDIDENAGIGDIVMCPQCRTRLEIIGLGPVILDYAMDEDTVGGE